jgi:nucleotide-binding universal stress UspA family protein
MNILIPTDFSESARNAFRYGVQLYGLEHRYFLFNAYEEPSSNVSSMVSLRDILFESSLDSLSEEREEFLKEFPGLDMKLVSEYSDPAEGVLHYVAAHSIDVVIMGTDGHAGLKKIMLGSVAGEVLKKSTVPVIVVPKNYTYTNPGKVLYTADLLDDKPIEFKDVFKSVIERNSSNITILTVTEPGVDIDEEKAEKGFGLHVSMNGYDHNFDVIESKDAGKAILNYMNEHQFQMLVTTPRKSSWFNRILHPSVSQHLAEHLAVPMMAMH